PPATSKPPAAAAALGPAGRRRPPRHAASPSPRSCPSPSPIVPHACKRGRPIQSPLPLSCEVLSVLGSVGVTNALSSRPQGSAWCLGSAWVPGGSARCQGVTQQRLESQFGGAHQGGVVTEGRRTQAYRAPATGQADRVQSGAQRGGR